MSQSLDGARSAAPFERVGDAVGQILRLAEAEADQLRFEARAEADAILADGRRAALLLREDADEYAEDKRAVVGREIARLMVETNRAAEEMLADAEAQAILRVKQAQQTCDKLREDAAAELEQLIGRREQVERVVLERTALAKQRAAEAREQAHQLRAIEADIARSQFVGEIDAAMTRQAATTLADAVAQAELVRSQALGELAEAVRRRDNIHHHLVELGRMLSAAADTPEVGTSARSVKAQARRSRPGHQPHRYNWAIAGARRGGRVESVADDC